jgi:hypothetical protein
VGHNCQRSNRLNKGTYWEYLADRSASLAPLTAKFNQWSETSYYGFGVFVVNGWIVQNPSFSGYAATMAYLPSHRLTVAVSATVREKASMDGNLSTVVLKEIAAYLAPEAPLRRASTQVGCGRPSCTADRKARSV